MYCITVNARLVCYTVPMKEKLWSTLLYSLPIFVMIGLIPIIQNDYVLTIVYIGCIIVLLKTRPIDTDWLALMVGVVGITASEFFFVSTCVEIFSRNTLFGIMPLWLPFLWGYGFITIERCLRILNRRR